MTIKVLLLLNPNKFSEVLAWISISNKKLKL